MAMPQRGETIEEIKRLEPPSPRLRRSSVLLEYAVMHGDETGTARLRAELKRLVEQV